MVAVTAFFSLLIAALVVVFAIKFRRKSDDEIGVAIHGSLALELLWTFIPLGIAMVMFAWGAKVFFDLYRPPAGAMEIFVVGKQWMWKAQHADGQREINELHVPIGRPVKLVMGSEDVIHSYYIPAFRVKADVIPGRYNSLWFTATKPGRYHLFCAEYCGTKHSGMIGWITAMEPADYQAWLAGGPATRVAGRRRREALQGSGVQHLPPGRARRAAGRCSPGSSARPIELQGGGTAVVDEAYIRESIVNPQAKVVGRLPADHADLPGAGDRRAAAAAHRLRAVARAAGRRGARRRRDRRSRYRNHMEHRELPQRRPRHQVLAVDERPQAHRAALPRVDHRLLRDGRVLRDVHPPGAADAGRRPAVERDLQQDVHHARRGDGLLLPHPVDSRGARQLPHPDHDRREGPGVPAHQPAQLVHLHPRRRLHDDGGAQRRRRHRAGRSTRRTARRRRTRT